jgi:hypothetical protein
MVKVGSVPHLLLGNRSSSKIGIMALVQKVYKGCGGTKEISRYLAYS